MPNNIRLMLIIFSLLLLVLVFRLVSKNKLSIRYSLLWILISLLILIVGFFPDAIAFITSKIGFKTTVNLVIAIILAMLLFVTLILTIIVTNHKRKIKLLIQEVSILKKEYDEKN